MLNAIHLRTLRECVRARSFAAAGRALGYTTSAVSRQMTMLERAVGTPLFERSAHSVRSTRAAEVLAARSGPVLDALTMLDRTAARFADRPVPTLDLGFCPSVRSSVVSATVARLVTGRPDLDVRLHRASRASLVHDVLADTLDAALVVDDPAGTTDADGALDRQPVLRELLLVAMPAGHRLCARDDVDPAELRDEAWVGAEPGSAEADALDSVAGAAGFVPRVVCRSNDHDVVVDLVRRGSGVALLPSAPDSGDGLVRRRLAGASVTRTCTLLTKPTVTGSALLRRVVDLLGATCRQSVADAEVTRVRG